MPEIPNGNVAGGTAFHRYPLTQYGNAERLIHRYGANIRYCLEYNAWFVWEQTALGTRWAELDAKDPVRLHPFAIDTVRRIGEELPRRGRPATDDEDKQDNAVSTFALGSERNSEIRGMIELARGIRDIQIHPTAFDPNRWLLNVSNGTVDLRTGELQPHRREDFITKLCPITYDPGAACPLWVGFLDKIFASDPDLIRYIQRVIGYTLTGHVSEKCFFMLHGPNGDNGKTTMVETIRALLGEDYCKVVPIETLTRSGCEAERLHAVAELCGRRFVTASESEEGEPLREAFIKNITGKGTLQGRRLYRPAFDFYPVFKLWIDGNHKLPIHGVDAAIWRRVRMIPFHVTIPKHEQDPHFDEKLLGELPGILAWAVQGAVAWSEHGLGEPPAVRDAVAQYRAEQDVIQRFIDERCEVAPDARVRPTELYDGYVAWLEATDPEQRPRKLAANVFGSQLESKGFHAVKNDGDRYRCGIRLCEEVAGAGAG